AAPLATLIRSPLTADLVPLEIDDTGSILTGHVARANPLWREADGQPVLAVFHGAQGYITPSWYASKAEDGRVVPTWNYSIVQAHGTLRAIDDAAWVTAFVTSLTDRHEATREHPWHVSDAPAEYIANTAKAIVGIEIAITSLVGKLKLSQNRTDEDQRSVLAALEPSQLAADMRAVRNR
ncbi:MAG TPA: FMN-binding negative transcriptional regulator, partial [Kofleriaceae bacterium]